MLKMKKNSNFATLLVNTFFDYEEEYCFVVRC